MAQKWGFGMAPIKPATQAARTAAAVGLLEFVRGDLAPRGRLEEITGWLSETKGLFSRAHRQDQWDWFTVWQALGRPGRRRAADCATALGELRRALVDGDRDRATAAARGFTTAGGPECLRSFLDGGRPPGEGLGYLYVLSTRESRELLKIGYTERGVEERVGEINGATGVPVPYGVRAVWVVRDARRLEGQVHALLAQWRVRPDREFFAMDYRDAAKLIADHVRASRAEQ